MCNDVYSQIICRSYSPRGMNKRAKKRIQNSMQVKRRSTNGNPLWLKLTTVSLFLHEHFPYFFPYMDFYHVVFAFHIFIMIQMHFMCVQTSQVQVLCYVKGIYC